MINILLVVNPEKHLSGAISDADIAEVTKLLTNSTWMSPVICHRMLSSDPITTFQRTFDAVVVMGGDGTLLNVARELADKQIPIIGINFGKLGYLANFDMKSFKRHLGFLLTVITKTSFDKGVSGISCRTILSVRTKFDNIFGIAINDLVIHRPLRVVEFKLFIDDHLIGTVSGDGVIIATPTGSTAYNLSAGGCIVQPELPGISITPNNPHRLSIRPMVIRSDQTIRLEITEADGILAMIDGQEKHELKFTDGFANVIVESFGGVTDNYKMQLVENPDMNNLETLAAKLNWGK